MHPESENSMSVCLYSCLSHPPYKAHAPYVTVICGQSASTTFLHITLYYCTTFGKRAEHKTSFDFLYSMSEKFRTLSKFIET
jgi:hypothetical protein